MFWLHLLLLLLIILTGLHYGGMAFGLLGGLGVAILAFTGVPPGHPPLNVMLIIIAVISASATLEATGGLELLIRHAEKLLRRHPDSITYLGPICTWSLTVLVGTGHSIYPLLPVIYDIAYKNGIRPERPLAISTVASQMGTIASPIAAAAAVVLSTAWHNDLTIGLIDVLKVTIPATFIGAMVAATWSLKRGRPLNEDPDFRKRLHDPSFRHELATASRDSDASLLPSARKGLCTFTLGIIAVIVLALLSDQLLPAKVDMSVAIQFMMLGVGAVILLLTNAKPRDIAQSSVFTAGMTAVVTIFGIAGCRIRSLSFTSRTFSVR